VVTHLAHSAILLLLGLPAYPEPIPVPRACEAAPPGSLVSRNAVFMGAPLRIDVLDTDRQLALGAMTEAFGAVRTIDDLLSTWRGDTEMARANAAPVGTPVALTPRLGALLDSAGQIASSTHRALEPALGALIDLWDLRGSGRFPSPPDLERTLPATGPEAISLTPDAGGWLFRRTRDAAWIDTGAFGKGAALDAAADALRAAGIRCAELDFGGQILRFGWNTARDLGIAHPVQRGQAALFVPMTNGSAATSAQSERFVTIDGTRWGHILDPRTGYPVPAWGSVTVFAASGLRADALSTALFVLGPDQALEWAARHPGIEVLVLVSTPDGLQVRTTPGLSRTPSLSVSPRP